MDAVDAAAAVGVSEAAAPENAIIEVKKKNYIQRSRPSNESHSRSLTTLGNWLLQIDITHRKRHEIARPFDSIPDAVG